MEENPKRLPPLSIPLSLPSVPLSLSSDPKQETLRLFGVYGADKHQSEFPAADEALPFFVLVRKP
jgi:hypothetical protein